MTGPRMRYPTRPGRGVDQGGPRMLRRVIDCGAVLREEVRLPTDCRFIYIERHGFAAQQCFVFAGRPSQELGADSTVTAAVSEGIDVTTFRGMAVQDDVDVLYVYSTLGLTPGTKLVIVCFVGFDPFVEPSRMGEQLTIAGVPTFDLVSIGGSSNQATLAALPALRVQPYGNVGGTVQTNAADHFNTNCANASNTLVRAGQGTGVNFSGVIVTTAAIALAYLRRNSDNADGGIAIGTALRAPEILAGGTSLFCRNNSGGAINVAGFLYVGLA